MLHRREMAIGRRDMAGRQLQKRQIMMILARAQEHHLVVDPVGHFEPHHFGVKGERPIDVAHLQDQMPQPRRSRAIGGRVAHHGFPIGTKALVNSAVLASKPCNWPLA